MTADDFMKILDDTKSVIISRDLFNSMLESQIPNRITAEEKIHDDAYDLGYTAARNEKTVFINDTLDKIIAEICDEFITIDGMVHDKSAEKCIFIIDKYRESEE